MILCGDTVRKWHRWQCYRAWCVCVCVCACVRARACVSTVSRITCGGGNITRLVLSPSRRRGAREWALLRRHHHHCAGGQRAGARRRRRRRDTWWRQRRREPRRRRRGRKVAIKKTHTRAWCHKLDDVYTLCVICISDPQRWRHGRLLLGPFPAPPHLLLVSRSADRLHVIPREVSRKLSTTSEYATIIYT